VCVCVCLLKCVVKMLEYKKRRKKWTEQKGKLLI